MTIRHTKVSDQNASSIDGASITKSKFAVTLEFLADPLSPLLSLSTPYLLYLCEEKPTR